MTFPRKTDVAMHLARKPRSASKLPPVVIPDKELPEIELQLAPVILLAAASGSQNTGTSALLPASIPAQPSLIPDDLTTAVRSAQIEDKVVAQ